MHTEIQIATNKKHTKKRKWLKCHTASVRGLPEEASAARQSREASAQSPGPAPN